jgi:DNA-binding CsgD family transcriptional regulator
MPIFLGDLNVDDEDAETAELTFRQLECLELVARGLTDTAIARKLQVRETTVRWHLDKARRKLSASTRSEAVAQAAWRGLIKP